MTTTPPGEAPWSQCNRRLKVIMLGSGDRANVQEEAARLKPLIEEHADVVLSDLRFEADLSNIEADFAVVLGGDGSMLRAARQIQPLELPAIGVNLGKLGFLAALQPGELMELLPAICSGDCNVVDHLMFRCAVMRGDETIHDELGLNETTILAGPPFSILDIELYVDSEWATTYSCDGLIISTPVGSTAHNLSAGGPIVRKSLQAFVISPISPHTLTVRPVVDSADRVYEMKVNAPNRATSVVVDGNTICQLTPDDRVVIRRAAATFKMLEMQGRHYYQTLRQKLSWGGDLRERKLRKQQQSK